MNRLTILAGLAAISLIAGPIAARADDTPSPKGGAVKGAVVGGVAGHMMGGHTKTGAAVGALAGHHERVKSQESINAGGKP
jgi:uncharacterized protein YcfJ